jgi:hypothetical protein
VSPWTTPRLAYVEVRDDDYPATSVAFLRRRVAWFVSKAITVQGAMTDDGKPYRSFWH